MWPYFDPNKPQTQNELKTFWYCSKKSNIWSQLNVNVRYFGAEIRPHIWNTWCGVIVNFCPNFRIWSHTIYLLSQSNYCESFSTRFSHHPSKKISPLVFLQSKRQDNYFCLLASGSKSFGFWHLQQRSPASRGLAEAFGGSGASKKFCMYSYVFSVEGGGDAMCAGSRFWDLQMQSHQPAFETHVGQTSGQR